MSVDLEKADEIFSNLDPEVPIALLVQPNPDPDCLGAAAGFGLLLHERYGLRSKIFHLGEVSHPQNKSMINVLHLKLNKGEGYMPETYPVAVVLDTDMTGTGFEGHASMRIDHHSMERGVGHTFEDVRIVGATCSIVWDWLLEAKVSLEEHPDVATALILGIKTDTAEFSSDTTTDLDFEAFKEIMPFVDRERLAKLAAYPLPKSLFEHEALALDSKIVKTSVLVSFIGTVVAQKRDEIPIIVDRFIRMDGINTAIILGIVNDDLVASVRSTDSRVNVADLCEEVFGEAFSGAKEGCGGAKVPLTALVPVKGMQLSAEAKAVMEAELFRHYADKIFEMLGE
jgi:nanoRNase/pAp phosphatase (c-di-AMP/oligoRNAs hydrolase)